jgi:hypothetical protein
MNIHSASTRLALATQLTIEAALRTEGASAPHADRSTPDNSIFSGSEADTRRPG